MLGDSLELGLSLADSLTDGEREIEADSLTEGEREILMHSHLKKLKPTRLN